MTWPPRWPNCRTSSTIAPTIERAIARDGRAHPQRLRRQRAGVPDGDARRPAVRGAAGAGARRARARPGIRLPACDALPRRDHRAANWPGSIARPRRCAGRRVLLVDDILDEGHTLAAVRAWCCEQGARDVRIAALAVKRHDRCVPGLCADYVGLEVPDRYVFGYGMDYHEQGRNLPAIYALRMSMAQHRTCRHRRHRRLRAGRTGRRRGHQPVTRTARRRPVRVGTLAGKRVAFLARHGEGHRCRRTGQLPRQPGRAEGARRDARAGAQHGRRHHRRLRPARAGLPGPADRLHLGPHFHDLRRAGTEVLHVDFGDPYTPALRAGYRGGARAGVALVDGGCYGATQGPRLETKAEIARMRRDGCDLVGMTGMPEAGLARDWVSTTPAWPSSPTGRPGAGPSPTKSSPWTTCWPTSPPPGRGFRASSPPCWRMIVDG